MRGSTLDQLIQLAADTAHVAQSRIEHLRNEIKKAEETKATAQAELEMARSAASQADSFQPEIGGNYQCPYCWVQRDIRSDLKPIPSAESDVDRFKCVTCDAVIDIQV